MTDPVTEQNAKIAEEKYGIPVPVYVMLCESFANTPLFIQIMNANAPVKAKISTAFALGMVIGWLKKGGQDELIEKVFTENAST